MARKLKPAPGAPAGTNIAARATAQILGNRSEMRANALRLARQITAGNAVAFSEEEIPLLAMIGAGYIRYSRAHGTAPGKTSVHGGTAPTGTTGKAGRGRPAAGGGKTRKAVGGAG